MKVLTVKSEEILDEDLQTRVNHVFGMEHYTDHIFKPRGDERYSATIVLERSAEVINTIRSKTVEFPEILFLIDDLDMEENTVARMRIRNGEILETRQTGWDWEK
jgi:hypothetical protein